MELVNIQYIALAKYAMLNGSIFTNYLAFLSFYGSLSDTICCVSGCVCGFVFLVYDP